MHTDITIVSAFGRAHWLASELAALGLKVTLIDVSDHLGRWAVEDKEGPFPLFRTERYSALQMQSLMVEGTLTQIDNGMAFLLPQGPLELKGPLSAFLLQQHQISPTVIDYLQNADRLSLADQQNLRKLMQEQDFEKVWMASFAHSLTAPYFVERWDYLAEGGHWPQTSLPRVPKNLGEALIKSANFANQLEHQEQQVVQQEQQQERQAQQERQQVRRQVQTGQQDQAGGGGGASTSNLRHFSQWQWFSSASWISSSLASLAATSSPAPLPQPLFAPLFLRQAHRLGPEQGARWCESNGVQVISAQVHDISFDRVVEGIELSGKWSGFLKTQQLIWMLTSEETQYMGGQCAAKLFPKGTLPPSWQWMRFRVVFQPSLSFQSLPLYFVLINNLFLEWTHEQFALINRSSLSGTSEADVWLKVPHIQRFHNTYLKGIADQLIILLGERFPGTSPQIKDMPQEYHYSYEELGPARFPLFTPKDILKLERKRFPNMFWSSVETGEDHSWEGRFRFHQLILKQFVPTSDSALAAVAGRKTTSAFSQQTGSTPLTPPTPQSPSTPQTPSAPSTPTAAAPPQQGPGSGSGATS